jgi:hypothetical protein
MEKETRELVFAVIREINTVIGEICAVMGERFFWESNCYYCNEGGIGCGEEVCSKATGLASPIHSSKCLVVMKLDWLRRWGL